MKVTNANWQDFAKSIATQDEPLLHSPAAMERYHAHMKDYIFHTRVPHGKYKAINNCELIDFVDEASQKRYQNAELKYIDIKGMKNYKHMNGYFKGYDIICFDDGKEIKYEVKYDVMSLKTGNICIEYESRGNILKASIDCCDKTDTNIIFGIGSMIHDKLIMIEKKRNNNK